MDGCEEVDSRGWKVQDKQPRQIDENMKRRPIRSKFVRVFAKDLQPPTRADMIRLKKAMSRPIDTSDMPEITAQDIRSGRLKPASPAAAGKRKPVRRV